MEVTYELTEEVFQRSRKAARRIQLSDGWGPWILTNVGIALTPAVPVAILAALNLWTPILVGVGIYAAFLTWAQWRSRRVELASAASFGGTHTITVDRREMVSEAWYGRVRRSPGAIQRVTVTDEALILFVDQNTAYLPIPCSAFDRYDNALVFAKAIERLAEQNDETHQADLKPSFLEDEVLAQAAWMEPNPKPYITWKSGLIASAIGLGCLGLTQIADPPFQVLLGAVGTLILSTITLMVLGRLSRRSSTWPEEFRRSKATLTSQGIYLQNGPAIESLRHWDTWNEAIVSDEGLFLQGDLGPKLLFIPRHAFALPEHLESFAATAQEQIELAKTADEDRLAEAET